MQLNTKCFGEIEIDEKGIITFPEGIPGFEDVKKFVMLGSTEENSPFQWLQSVDNTDLAFVVIDPKHFKPDYVVDVNDADIAVLDIHNVDKVLVLTVVVIPEDITKMTTNLRAPVLINTENNRGKQVIQENGEYQIRHFIMEELRKIGGKK